MKSPYMFICLFCILFAEQAFGSMNRKNNNFSFRLGYSMTNFTGDDVTNMTYLRIKDEQLFSFNPYQKNPRKGITLGIGYSYSFSKQLFLQFEANYEEKGCVIHLDSYQILGDFYSMNNVSTLKINYLTLPILFRFFPGDLNLFYFEGGLYYSHLLLINETGTIRVGEEQVTYEHVNENINNEDAGFTLGTGIHFKVSRDNALAFGIRYSRSILPPAKYHQMDPTKVYGQYLSIALSYSFKL